MTVPNVIRAEIRDSATAFRPQSPQLELPTAQRSAEVELPEELPMPVQRDREIGCGRHVPAVEIRPAHQLIAAAAQISVLVARMRVILEQDKARPITAQRKTLEDFELGALDVD